MFARWNRLSALMGVLALFAFSVTGCGHKTVDPGPSERDRALVAASHTMTLVSDLDVFRFFPDGDAAALRAAAPGLARHATAAPAATTRDVVMHAYDRAGNELPFDPANPAGWESIWRLTADVRWIEDTDDPVTGEHFGVRAAGNAAITGFAPSEPRITFDAAMHDTLDVSQLEGAIMVRYRGRLDLTIDQLVFSRTGGYPLSGSEHIVVDLRRSWTDASGAHDEPLQLDLVIRFDGSSVATVIVDGKHTFKMNLDTGAIQ